MLPAQVRQSSEESNKEGGRVRLRGWFVLVFYTQPIKTKLLYMYNFYDDRFCNWESIFLVERTLELN